MPANHVKAAFGCDLLPALGNKAGRMGRMGQADGFHFRRHRHFEIQRNSPLAGHAGKGLDVGVGDVTAVLPQVGGNAIRARGHGQFCGAHGVGIICAASIPDRGDVVDVYAQTKPVHLDSLRLPGSSTGMAASSGGSWSAG